MAPEIAAANTQNSWNQILTALSKTTIRVPMTGPSIERSDQIPAGCASLIPALTIFPQLLTPLESVFIVYPAKADDAEFKRLVLKV